jgi:hypothetical protein
LAVERLVEAQEAAKTAAVVQVVFYTIQPLIYLLELLPLR